MAIVFLCGGTGNQMFQFTRSKPGDRFSRLFLHGRLPRKFGWTEHSQVLEFATPNRVVEVVALVALGFDALVAKLLGRSLFTRFDLRALKAEPMIARWLQFGYFQNCEPTRDADELSQQIVALGDPGELGSIDIAMHVRGGDVLKLQQQGRNPYGQLKAGYFASVLAECGAGRHLTVYTDDGAYARQLLESIELGMDFIVDEGSLEDMLAGCVSAETFIACNSTLSYWIVRLRGKNRRSFAPQPFARDLALENPEYVVAISVEY